MSAYEELVRRCYEETYNATRPDIMAVIAEVLRTLENVTPEMQDAWDLPLHPTYDVTEEMIEWVWKSMLHASPLVPPK